MKKITLVFSGLCFVASVSYSQFNKGSLLSGVDLSFNTGTSINGTNESKAHGVAFSPTIAVATKQNTFWGGSLSAGYSKNESGSPNSTQTSNSYNAGIFYRKYKPVLGMLYAFIQAGVSGGFGKFETDNGPDSYSESRNFGIGLNITPGISVGVSKKVFLEAGFSNIAAVNYNHSKSSSYNFGTTTTGKSSGFGFSSSLGNFNHNLYFGFRFILPGKS